MFQKKPDCKTCLFKNNLKDGTEICRAPEHINEPIDELMFKYNRSICPYYENPRIIYMNSNREYRYNPDARNQR